MNRRNFLNTCAATTLLGGALNNKTTSFQPTAPRGPGSQSDSHELLKSFHVQNDLLIATLVASQQADQHQPFYGGFSDAYGICHVGTAAWNSLRMVCGLISKSSRYYESQQVTECLERAIGFVKQSQHEDGTIDLVTTNFHSTPDTGFVVEPIALALSCVSKIAPSQKQLSGFQAIAKSFLVSAAEALARGGIHTPNHRWVVCMALARINQLFPAEKYVARIEQWLAEKIDIDAEGHYSERSTGVYSPLTNRCLITIARLLDRPSLLEPVRKNLEMTIYLVRPNGEVVTEVSRRQDQYRIQTMGRYYQPYRWLAIHDGNQTFAAMARLIEDNVGIENLNGQLAYFLDDTTLQGSLPPSANLPDKYEKMFKDSQIVRIRDQDLDATILGGNATFFTCYKGNAGLRAIRLASAFFGKGQFVAQQLSAHNGSYRLVQELQGPYYQPLAEKKLLAADGDWRKMPRDQRAQSEIQKLKTEITVRKIHRSFQISFKVTGTENVPLAIELAFGNDGVLSGVSPVAGIENASLISSQPFEYRIGEDAIQFSSGAAKHSWTQLRGALPKLDAQCVYITDFTPFEFELTVS